MKSRTPDFPAPLDAEKRKAISPVICYPVDQLRVVPLELYFRVRKNFKLVEFGGASKESTNFRNSSRSFLSDCLCGWAPGGRSQPLDAENLQGRICSGKTRALHGTHLSTGDRF